MATTKKPAAKKQAKATQLTINKKEALKPVPGTVKSQGKWTETKNPFERKSQKPVKVPSKKKLQEIMKTFGGEHAVPENLALGNLPKPIDYGNGKLRGFINDSLKAILSGHELNSYVIRCVESEVDRKIKEAIDTELQLFKLKYRPWVEYELALVPLNVRNNSDNPVEVHLFDPTFKNDDIKIETQATSVSYAEILNLLLSAVTQITEIKLTFDIQNEGKVGDPISKLLGHIHHKNIYGESIKTPMYFKKYEYQYQNHIVQIDCNFELKAATYLVLTIPGNSVFSFAFYSPIEIKPLISGIMD